MTLNNKIALKVCLVIVLMLCLRCTIVTAKATESHSQASWPKWINNKWPADDAPYLKIRQEIDQAILNGASPDDILQRAETEEHGHLKSPLSVFHLAYAGYKAGCYVYYHLSLVQKNIIQTGTRKQFLVQQSKELNARLAPANAALNDLPDPHSYEYARLKFLYWRIGDNATGGGYADLQEGKYLVEHNPNDWEVKETLSIMLASRSEKSSTEQALVYATEVVHALPDDPKAWEIFGIVNGYFASVEDQSVFRTKYAPVSLAALQKCVNIAPPDYGPRSTIELEIKHLKSVLNL